VVIFLNCKKSFWLIYDGYGKDVIDKPNLSMTARQAIIDKAPVSHWHGLDLSTTAHGQNHHS
jgi:hypothetical protein